MKYNIYKLAILLIFVLLIAACNDFLDREPLDEITAEGYFDDEAALASYAINSYGVLPVHSNTGYSIGIAGIDNGTDNQITSQYEDRWVPGEVKLEVPEVHGILETFVPVTIFLNWLSPNGRMEKYQETRIMSLIILAKCISLGPIIIFQNLCL